VSLPSLGAEPHPLRRRDPLTARGVREPSSPGERVRGRPTTGLLRAGTMTSTTPISPCGSTSRTGSARSASGCRTRVERGRRAAQVHLFGEPPGDTTRVLPRKRVRCPFARAPRGAPGGHGARGPPSSCHALRVLGSGPCHGQRPENVGSRCQRFHLWQEKIENAPDPDGLSDPSAPAAWCARGTWSGTRRADRFVCRRSVPAGFRPRFMPAGQSACKRRLRLHRMQEKGTQPCRGACRWWTGRGLRGRGRSVR